MGPSSFHLQRLRRLPFVEEALRQILVSDSRTLDDQVALTLIPAPPFGEDQRARRMLELLSEAGLSDATLDPAGNVVARYDLGADPDEAPLVVSAHLDTAFPPGTPVTLRREGSRLRAPGIADDGRGLAALVALARTLRAAEVPLSVPILFVATVGEEGAGDLRGVKELFSARGAGHGARGFISLDGAGIEGVVVRGVGSRRLRITVGGPGGHSWSDFGVPNPVHLLAEVVARITRIPLTDIPRTTCTVARWGGGTGINAIPEDAWVEVDLRSEDPRALADLEDRVRNALKVTLEGSEQAAGLGGERVHSSVTVIGDRPAGSTDPDSPLVRATLAATRFLGRVPTLLSASTDANLPMSLGIPALTIGAGGRAGGAHTLDEWYDNTGGPEGIQRALLTVLLAVGVPRPAGAPGD
jgi:tripeptide aminopeptidase